MIDIQNVIPGQPYACHFKVQTMLDSEGQPFPNLNQKPIQGPGWYQGFGVLIQRDLENELVKLKDQNTGKEFTVPFSDIWDIDDIEWIDPLESKESTAP